MGQTLKRDETRVVEHFELDAVLAGQVPLVNVLADPGKILLGASGIGDEVEAERLGQ